MPSARRCGTYAPLSAKNLACKSILCRFGTAAPCGGGATSSHPRKKLGRTQINEARFSDLGWDWCFVLTRIDAKTSLCDGLSHILTYQAVGSADQYRVNENDNGPHLQKPSTGLFKIQALCENQQVGPVIASVLILFCDARLVLFHGWAQVLRELPKTCPRGAILNHALDDGWYERVRTSPPHRVCSCWLKLR